VRCLRCGNENSEENRFCGMCGAKLTPVPVAVTAAPAVVSSKMPAAVSPKATVASPSAARSAPSLAAAGACLRKVARTVGSKACGPRDRGVGASH